MLKLSRLSQELVKCTWHGIHVFLNALLFVGIMLFFLSNLYWFQLNRTMGPIATTMNKVISDVLMVAYAYGVFFLAFVSGFHLILNKIVVGTEDCDGDEVLRNGESNIILLTNLQEYNSFAYLMFSNPTDESTNRYM